MLVLSAAHFYLVAPANQGDYFCYWFRCQVSLAGEHNVTHQAEVTDNSV